MAAPGPEGQRHYVVGGRPLSWFLMLVAAILMFIAACVADGANILGVPALAWAFWSLCAWLFAGVV